jgi:hypothetical protein
MFKITNYQGNANQNHSNLPLHDWDDQYKKAENIKYQQGCGTLVH